MTSSCIVFTTDNSYLLPTLVSAIQARQKSSVALADVLVVGVGLSIESVRVFAPIFDREDICFLPLEQHAIDHQSAMLARLFLDKILPAQYEQFLYMDGDVHIHQSLDALIETNVPDGHILAANDPIAFLLQGLSPMARRLAQYFNSVRVPEYVTAHYFNSGVLRMPRAGWDSISASALKHYKTHHRLARFPDQDALNMAGHEVRLTMSLAWNFPVFLRNAGLENEIVPRVTHFMASPKPWQGNYRPWDAKAVRPYLDILVRYPELEQWSHRFSPRMHAVYKLQQFGKRWNEAIVWGIGARRKRILDYEKHGATIGGSVTQLALTPADS